MKNKREFFYGKAIPFIPIIATSTLPQSHLAVPVPRQARDERDLAVPDEVSAPFDTSTGLNTRVSVGGWRRLEGSGYIPLSTNIPAKKLSPKKQNFYHEKNTTGRINTIKKQYTSQKASQSKSHLVHARVVHEMFGSGTIQAVDTKDTRTVFTIRFGLDTKKIDSRFVKIVN
jgi:hypothetical protein